LPLNIFEPRYLNMFDDAMRGDRIIGMIQSLGGPRDRPNLARVGCAGRITRYSAKPMTGAICHALRHLPLRRRPRT
jgi:uncharacterized protein